MIGTALYTYLDNWDDTYPLNRFPNNVKALDMTGYQDFSGGGAGGTARWNWRRALGTYIKGKAVWQCPSNDYAWANGGDESNTYYKNEADKIPNSYPYNGGFFQESAPVFTGVDTRPRPRELSEIKDPSGLLCISDSSTFGLVRFRPSKRIASTVPSPVRSRTCVRRKAAYCSGDRL